MNSDDDARVEAAPELTIHRAPMDPVQPPVSDVPARPRPNSRTIYASIGDYSKWKISRVGMTLDIALEEELDDYRGGLAYWIEQGMGDADSYAATEADVAIWEGERCLALVRPRVGGEPEIMRFDGGDAGWPSPFPSTEGERAVWSFIKDYGAEPCREALCAKFLPGSQHGPAEARSRHGELSPSERVALDLIRDIGQGEAMDRLLMMGPYEAVHQAIRRLGTDAVAELRRQIEDGLKPTA